MILIHRGTGTPVDPGIWEARLSLSPTYPVYRPQPFTPTSTDTTAETVTFAAHGLSTGTICTPSATGGGLTTGTTYYARAVSVDAIAFYTTLADALADTSRVNLTASITAQIMSAGITNKTLYLLPHKGNRISLYTGTGWVIYALPAAGLSLAFSSTLGASSSYDAFVDYNDGAPALIVQRAWVSEVGPRLDLLGVQDGVEVLAADLQQRWAGSVWGSATDTAIDADLLLATGVAPWGVRGLWNRYHQEARRAGASGGTGHTYNSATVRAFNADSTIFAAFMTGLPQVVGVTLRTAMTAAATGAPRMGLGLDSTTAYAEGGSSADFVAWTAVLAGNPALARALPVGIGFHRLQLLQSEPAATVSTFTLGHLAVTLAT